MEVVNKYTLTKECNSNEAQFLLSKTKLFANPHFYIVWIVLKNPPIGRPIVAGCDWILKPASIFIGTFLIKFYSKVENILTDSLELIRFIDKNTFYLDGMLFTIDFYSINQKAFVQNPKCNPKCAFSG